MGMFQQLVTPGYAPFSIALAVLVGIVAIEGLSMIAGHSASHFVESLFGGDAPDAPDADAGHGMFGGALDWLNIGRAPFLALLAAALGIFAACGFLLQGMAGGIVAPLPGWMAAILAVVPTVPATRLLSRALGRVMPREETYVVTEAEFVGRTGVITVGPARRGVVARMKLQDQYGNWHFPKIEPFTEEDEIPEGALVLVVEQEEGVLRVAKADGKLVENL
jgi:membrane protein implicated in regulation of membrane protease activity